jgi:tetratricopeptide (TPR) repeat protein
MLSLMGVPNIRTARGAFQHAIENAERGNPAVRRELRAGMMLMEAIERVGPGRTGTLGALRNDIRAARRLIVDLPTGYGMRAALLALADGAVAALGTPLASGETVSSLVELLLAYAKTLRSEGRWVLATSVYQLAISRAESRTDFGLLPDAYLRYGYCLRMEGRLVGALAAYRTGHAVASSLGDAPTMLRIRIAEAGIHRQKGDRQHAEEMLKGVVTEAERHKFGSERAMATHDLGAIAYDAGQYDVAVRCFYDAWSHYGDRARKDRALSDLAQTLADLGLRDAARDALLLIMSSAAEREMRLKARITLLELAAQDGELAVFEQYRRDLSAQAMPARLTTHFHVLVGDGYRRFGRPQLAASAYQRAIRFGSRHQAADLVQRAEAGARAVAAGVQANWATPLPLPRSAAPADVQQVTSALREMWTAQSAAVQSAAAAQSAGCQNYQTSSSISNGSLR